jgi:hypothetical protein
MGGRLHQSVVIRDEWMLYALSERLYAVTLKHAHAVFQVRPLISLHYAQGGRGRIIKVDEMPNAI